MKPYKILFLYFCLCYFIACQNTSKDPVVASQTITEIPTPCKTGGEPNLFTNENGEVYLSWVEKLNDSTTALQFSTLEKDQWSAPKTIATGTDWFVNWADFPSLVTYAGDDNLLAAHWLQKSAGGTYDYDVHIAQSQDGGTSWGESFIPHQDGIAAEHGFVSMIPLSANRIFATWLDGRNTKGEGHEDHDSHGHDDHGHGAHGAMTLRAATFDSNGKLYDEVELDNKVCDCCQTSAALTDQGVIVAYRDRSDEEVRDISIIQQVGNKWTQPVLVAKDNWQIVGCPVNGPVIKAKGKQVVVAWFTMAGEEAQVKIAFSEDSGTTFSPPVRIDEGKPLGRVDVVLLANKEALVSWLEESETGADIKAVKVSAKEKTGESFTVAATDPGRQSGFPQMVRHENKIVFAWVHVDNPTIVKTAMIKL